MGVGVSWDDQAKTILRLDYSEKWTWAEVSTAMDEGITLMRSVTGKVCIIHDLTRSAAVPAGALTNAKRFTTGLPPNWDLSIVVGSGTFTETLLNIFSRVYIKLGEHYRTAQNIEDARKIIAQHRAK